MIFTAFSNALGQIGDPRFRRVLFLGIALTIILLAVASACFVWFVGWLAGDTSTLPIIGEVTWVGNFFSWVALALMITLSVFLMVPVASAITSMFLDAVAAAVEAKHYPNLPPAEGVDFATGLRDTVNFLGVLILANVVALVLYVLLPFAALFIFWGLNGYLLGREYFMLAAMRRIGRANARAMRSRHNGTIWLAGTLMAVPLTVPLINLVIPILGAATFTHIFHMLRESER